MSAVPAIRQLHSKAYGENLQKLSAISTEEYLVIFALDIVASIPTLVELELGQGMQTMVAIALTDMVPIPLHAELEQIPALLSMQVADLTDATELILDQIDIAPAEDGQHERQRRPGQSWK